MILQVNEVVSTARNQVPESRIEPARCSSSPENRREAGGAAILRTVSEQIFEIDRDARFQDFQGNTVSARSLVSEPPKVAALRAQESPAARSLVQSGVDSRPLQGCPERLLNILAARAELFLNRIPQLMGIVLSFVLVLSLSLFGCFSKPSDPDPDAVREKAADATAALKRNAKAIAQGVREGWTRDHPLNVNTAKKQDLQQLPGVTPHIADRIIQNRPYAEPSELVKKHVLTKSEYDRIADRLIAKP